VLLLLAALFPAKHFTSAAIKSVIVRQASKKLICAGRRKNAALVRLILSQRFLEWPMDI